jgi:TonB family protein
MKIFQKLSIFFIAIILFGCSNQPQQLTIKDVMDIEKPLSDILKDGYGLYADKSITIPSSYDFHKLNLVIIGEMEANMDIRLVTLGIEKTNRFLFNQIQYVQISDNMSNPVKDKPCMTAHETMAINGREILCVREMYSKGAEYKDIVGSYITGSNSNCVYLMKKEYAADFSDNLNELIVKSTNDPNIKMDIKESDTMDQNGNSLEVPPPPPPPAGDTKIIEEKQDIFQVVEEMPQFPGGDGAMFKFITEHIVYPESAKDNGIEGKVYAQFVVQSNGKITNINVLRGIDPSLDAEAVRVIKLFPAWKPGKQNGKPVNVYYTVPIKFELE